MNIEKQEKILKGAKKSTKNQSDIRLETMV